MKATSRVRTRKHQEERRLKNEFQFENGRMS